MALLLNNLEIDGFRGINKLRMEGLGRVNLLVGKNNAGKTRTLEALRILGNKGGSNVFSQISKEHDEIGDKNLSPRNASFLSGFFSNRKLPTDWNSGFFIGETNGLSLKLEARPFVRKEIEEYSPRPNETDESPKRVVRSFITKETALSYEQEEVNIYYGLVLEYKIDKDTPIEKRTLAFEDQESDEIRFSGGLARPFEKSCLTPTSYIPTGLIDKEQLSYLWDQTVLTEDEVKVVESLNIIDKSILGVAFVENKFSRHRVPLVKTVTSDQPTPLSSLGDGVNRALQLALSLVDSANGLLLVDEFENGLHYSVQVELWKFIFDYANKLNIQVFATTHSSDCIAAFAEAATNHPELGCAYHLGQSIIDGKTIATRYEEARLKELVDMGRDIR